MNAAVQDAWPSSACSPQILAGGLTREVFAASSELSSVADAEAEIRRLTQVGLPILVPAMMGPYLSKTHLVIFISCYTPGHKHTQLAARLVLICVGQGTSA